MITAFQRGLSGPVGAKIVEGRHLFWWAQRIDAKRRVERRAVWTCFAVGLGLNGVVLAAMEGLMRVIGHYHDGGPQPHGMGVAIGGVSCLGMLLIAAFIKPEGRAEQASRLVKEGFQSAARSQNPAVGVVAVVLMMIALYGCFAIVEAARRTIVRCRLAGVDRAEMARILAAADATPMGVSVKWLLKSGQRPADLRRPVAALLLDGWVTLSEGGRVIDKAGSLARLKARRHPLAEVFAGDEANGCGPPRYHPATSLRVPSERPHGRKCRPAEQ